MKILNVKVLVGLALLVLISVPAQAALEVYYRIDGVGSTTVPWLEDLTPSNPSVASVTNATLGVFSITLNAQSDAPGLPGFAELLGSTTTVVNNATTAHTLELFFVGSDFNQPLPPVIFDAELTVTPKGTFVPNGQVNMFRGCLINGAQVSGTNCLAATVPSADMSGTILHTANFLDDDQVVYSGVAAGFSMAQYVDITLQGGEMVQAISNTTLVPTTVPEPISIALLGGVLVLTSGLIRRRTKGGSAV